MNVWIVNHFAIPPDSAGGTRHHTLARLLVRAGHEVTIVAANIDYLSWRERKLSGPGKVELREESGVPFLWIKTPTHSGSGSRRLVSMVAFASRLIGRATDTLSPPDVVVGSSPHPFAAFGAALLARRHGVPFVLEVRDIWPKTLVDVGGIAALHPIVLLLSLLERWLYSHADHIVTLMPSARDHLVPRGADPDRITWIPNGIDLAVVKAPPAPAREPFVLMYTGTHGRANALTLVLDAAKCLIDDGWGERVLFRMIGDGVCKQALRQRAADEHLYNVHFEQPVAKAEIYSTMAQADAYVVAIDDLPLYRSGVSFNKFFDYLAMQRPTIVATAGVDNPITSSGGGITTALSGRAIANAVKLLVQMPEQSRSELGRRGYNYVRAHHDMTSLSDRLARVLETAIGRRRAIA